jgi:hypothetical protein
MATIASVDLSDYDIFSDLTQINHQYLSMYYWDISLFGDYSKCLPVSFNMKNVSPSI